MSLLDDFSGQYEVGAKCTNCERYAYVKIRKGITVDNFFKRVKPACKVCGCQLKHSLIAGYLDLRGGFY